MSPNMFLALRDAPGRDLEAPAHHVLAARPVGLTAEVFDVACFGRRAERSLLLVRHARQGVIGRELPLMRKLARGAEDIAAREVETRVVRAPLHRRDGLGGAREVVRGEWLDAVEIEVA